MAKAASGIRISARCNSAASIPKTGKVTEYPVKTLKPGYPVGMLDLERDKQGSFWLGSMFLGISGREIRSQDTEVSVLESAERGDHDVAQINMVATKLDVSGKGLGTNNVGHGDIYRLDLKTGQYAHFQPYGGSAGGSRCRRIARMRSTASLPIWHDNLFFTDFVGRWIGRVDAQTGKASFYATPSDNSRPRRGQGDGRPGSLLVRAGNTAPTGSSMLDTKTQMRSRNGKCRRRGPRPTMSRWTRTASYGPAADHRPDRPARSRRAALAVEYPMPRDTNTRRVFVDETHHPGHLLGRQQSRRLGGEASSRSTDRR